MNLLVFEGENVLELEQLGARVGDLLLVGLVLGWGVFPEVQVVFGGLLEVELEGLWGVDEDGVVLLELEGDGFCVLVGVVEVVVGVGCEFEHRTQLPHQFGVVQISAAQDFGLVLALVHEFDFDDVSAFGCWFGNFHLAHSY